MQRTLLAQIRDGQHYSKIWPDTPSLAVLFPEYRIIKATQFGFKVMPMLAVLLVSVQLSFFGSSYAPQSLAFALFILSMPMQGLYWLGKRANTQLPPNMATWYREILTKMEAQGHSSQVSKTRPRYIEMAQLLKEVFEKMDSAFRKDIF